MNVIILGSTGLTGKYLLQYCIENDAISSIHIYNRKSVGYNHPKLHETITDFSNINELSIPSNIDTIYSCLGTTKAQTPDVDKYIYIERDIPTLFIEKCIHHNLKQVHYISATGVGKPSKNNYMNIKYLAEKAISEYSANIAVYLYRPSLIKGDRNSKRFIEDLFNKIFKFITPIFIGPLKNYKPVHAKTIANTMLQKSLLHKINGVYIIENDQIINDS